MTPYLCSSLLCICDTWCLMSQMYHLLDGLCCLSFLLHPREGYELLWYVCLSVRLHNSKTTQPNFTKFFVHVAMARSFSDGIVIHYVLPVLCVMSCMKGISHSQTLPALFSPSRYYVLSMPLVTSLQMMSCFHNMGPMDRQARHCVVCRLAVRVDMATGWVQAAMAYWLSGLACWRCIGQAGHAGCFMLVVNCTPGPSLLSVIGLSCVCVWMVFVVGRWSLKTVIISVTVNEEVRWSQKSTSLDCSQQRYAYGNRMILRLWK